MNKENGKVVVSEGILLEWLFPLLAWFTCNLRCAGTGQTHKSWIKYRRGRGLWC
jgi:hypothetical protein